MVRFRLLCGDFLLPDPAPHLENRKTVCMGLPGDDPARAALTTAPTGEARRKCWRSAPIFASKRTARRKNWLSTRGEPENAAGRGLEIHAERTAHSVSTLCVTAHLMWTICLHEVNCRSLIQCVQTEHKQAVQTLRRKAPDSDKCANGVQKVCSRFPA